ncbi:MAG: BACON domain-containing protein [Bacteroidales bacterium]
MFKIKFESVVLLLFTVVVLFTGCKEDTFVSSSVQKIEIAAEGGQERFQISASGSWEVSSSQDWCKLSTTSGTGDANLFITVSPNDDLNEREATIDIKSGSSRSRVIVIQDGLEFITLSSERIVVGNTNGSVNITVAASAAWEVSKDSEWISKISPDNALGSSDVKIDFAANELDDNRTATVSFKIKGSSTLKILTIEQLSVHGNARQRDSIALEAFASNCLTINRENVWNRSLPINRWAGVATKIVAGEVRVTELNSNFLFSASDGGSTPFISGAHLPSELQFLTEITTLQISGVNLGGEIPSFLGKLTKLTTLNLSGNLFEGTLPNELSELKSLRVLNVSANYLSGDLPTFIGDLTSLVELNISINNFQRIPDNFARLINLTRLYMYGLGEAVYGGELPSSEVAKAKRLRVNRNYNVENVERDFPVTITYLSKLENLRMHSSNFKGTIPSTISNMQSLSEFVAHTNKLSGQIPSSIQFATKIQVLNLARNNLSGSIPEGLSALSQYLLTLILSDNNLSGELPSDFKDLYCTYWDLSNNNLTGGVDVIFNRGWAVEVYLNNNQFSGPFPSSVGSAVQIEKIQASNNNFTSIPDEIINLIALVDLTLDNNKITEINSNLQYLSRLSILHLHNNDIIGEIPSFLGKINHLSTLTLFGNKLVGQVPQSLITLNENNTTSPSLDITWTPAPFDWNRICPQQDGYGVDFPSGFEPDNASSGLDGELPSIAL